MDEIIKLMNFAKEYGVFIEFNSFSMIIRKYGETNGRPYKYNMAFAIEIIAERGLEKCFDYFEKYVNEEIKRLKEERTK